MLDSKTWYEKSQTEYNELNLVNCATSTTDETILYNNMISKRKKELVLKIYKENHPRSSKFYKCADGRQRSKKTNFLVQTENELIEKLCHYYFGQTMQQEFDRWILKRIEISKVSPKTIEADMGYWRRVNSKEPLATVLMNTIRPIQIYDLFDH